jgi:hypothetical protein
VKQKRNESSRGHGGVVYVRGLSDSLSAERQRKADKKIARLAAHPLRPTTPRIARWAARLASRLAHREATQ